MNTNSEAGLLSGARLADVLPVAFETLPGFLFSKLVLMSILSLVCRGLGFCCRSPNLVRPASFCARFIAAAPVCSTWVCCALCLLPRAWPLYLWQEIRNCHLKALGCARYKRCALCAFSGPDTALGLPSPSVESANLMTSRTACVSVSCWRGTSFAARTPIGRSLVRSSFLLRTAHVVPSWYHMSLVLEAVHFLLQQDP